MIPMTNTCPSRGIHPTRAVLTGLLALLGGLPAAQAADDHAELGRQLRQLMERVQQLEQSNRALEERLRLQPPTQPVATAPTQFTAPQAAEPAAEEEAGLKVEGGLLAVAQHSNRAGTGGNQSTSRLNYRGDLEFTLPLGRVTPLSEAQLQGFGHLRFGQGSGLALRPTYTATGNSIAFESAGGSQETYGVIAQAWVQATWPMSGSGLNEQRPSRVELTMGKIDMFGFFDQNAVAGDEGAQFLNNAFVHNPLLDSGGDIAADAYGMAPGLRLAWIDEGEDRGWSWGLSAGVFGSGAGADFNTGLGRPLLIVQAEISPKQINGEARGTYRLYGWSNGHTTDLTGTTEQRHSGWGLSVDHKLGRDWNLFGRWGLRTSGDSSFDQALTLGFEHGGRAWGRGKDVVGLAVGWLRTDPAWKAATAADSTLVGYSAQGRERVAELYYRMKLNNRIDLTPDVQIISRPGGQSDTKRVVLWGLRTSVSF